MKSRFPLFQSHLDLAHHYWEQLVQPGDLVIDATCGNGNDTLFLAKLALTPDSGEVIGMDLQGEAIQKTRDRLKEELPPTEIGRIKLIQGCHSVFPVSVTEESVRLIVYNLGYLPGADKSCITLADTTFQSLKLAVDFVSKGGAISITCYPGHAGGDEEQKQVLEFTQGLDPKEWNCCHHQWINRKNSPSLLFLQKKV